jgi:hypothetical protein
MEIAFLALALAVAGVAGFLHTVFFFYKMFVSRGTAGYEQINYEEQGLHAHTHGSSDLLSGSVPLSSSTMALALTSRSDCSPSSPTRT